MADRKLLIVDGYSLLFRAFYSTRYLSTAAGKPTNALYGFTSMLFTLIEQQRPDCILIALDAHAKTFRHEEFEAYKGTRKETPQELLDQLIESRALIQALGIPILEKDGFEADDVVGTISKQAEEKGYLTTIITGDLDALQLVDDCVTVVTPKTGVSEVAVYNPQAVRDRYGFDPVLIPDYKALVGDTSDNIPGVPGVGDKTASKLIQQFGPVEEIMARLPEVEEKFRKKLEPALAQIPKSKWLATIVRDAPVEFDFEPFRVDEDHLARAEQELVTLEFKSHARRLRSIFSRYSGNGQGPVAEVVQETIEAKKMGRAASYEALSAWVAGRPFALVFAGGAVQQSMFDDAAREAFIAVGDEVWSATEAWGEALFQQDPALAIGHDVKPLYRKFGGTQPPRFDAMVAGYVLQSGRTSYGLRELVQGYLDALPPETPEQLAVGLHRAEKVMTDRLKAEDQLKVATEIEFPLIPALAQMETNGIAVSRDFLQEFSKGLEGDIASAQAKVFELAGQTFLIASPKQLGEVLFEKMKLEGGKKTKTGWATGAEILQEIEHPIAKAILQYRELTKLKSTYADALPRMIGEDGRIHTSFNQTVAATGRLSSNEPNLQNIPIRTELGRQIRKAFVAGPGFVLASFDYSQIELRLLAELCKDDALVDAFQKRVDVHTVTAALMFHLQPEDVTKEQRRLAKMLNYAVLYGVTDFGLAQQLGEGFDVKQSKELIQQYFERFPKVKAYTESVVAEARSKGFTTTLRGRRRYFPEIHAANRAERLYAERQAMNAPIQGAAADLVKLAMLDVAKLLRGRNSRMLLQVHDELVFELDPNEKELIPEIRRSMEDAMPIGVPIEVDSKIGPNWNEMTPVER